MKEEVIKILGEAAKTLEERHAVYGDNHVKVGAVMKAMFPGGHVQAGGDFEKENIMFLMVTKLCRFANSGMTHKDSIRDMMIYAAIMEHLCE